MIITLVKADFSSNNVGTLSTWTVTTQFEAGVTLTSPADLKSIDREGTTATSVTLALDTTNYTLDSAKVLMGGVDKSGEWGVNTTNLPNITFTIPAGNTLTGNIIIDVNTTRIGGEVEPETPTNYTFTINPTPVSATVTLSATGYSTVSGTGSKSITVANGTTVNWNVSADGYTEQNGTWTANGSNKTENIVLVASETPVNLWKYSSSDMDAIMENARYRLATGLPYKEEGDDFDKTYGATEKIYVNGNTGTYTLDLQSGKTYRWQFIPYHEYGFLKLHNPWGGPEQTKMNGKRVFFYKADDSLIENDSKCLDETGMLVTVPQDAVYMRFMAWGYHANTSHVKPRYDTLMITEGETEYSEYVPYQS